MVEPSCPRIFQEKLEPSLSKELTFYYESLDQKGYSLLGLIFAQHRETRPLPLEVNEGPRSSDKDQLVVLSILGNLGLYFIIPSNF